MAVGKLEVTVSGATPGNWEVNPVSDNRSVLLFIGYYNGEYSWEMLK